MAAMYMVRCASRLCARPGHHQGCFEQGQSEKVVPVCCRSSPEQAAATQSSPRPTERTSHPSDWASPPLKESAQTLHVLISQGPESGQRLDNEAIEDEMEGTE